MIFKPQREGFLVSCHRCPQADAKRLMLGAGVSNRCPQADAKRLMLGTADATDARRCWRRNLRASCDMA